MTKCSIPELKIEDTAHKVLLSAARLFPEQNYFAEHSSPEHSYAEHSVREPIIALMAEPKVL